ncbi:hypothetical protein FQA47_009499 [Oryzias melastigma]|uniref:Uncharacterized protein n=1 Tax=Oryzias melastigma TaxID=30732 RepID=A0A834CHI5_ORYME|nr:hypothetical protein FQA47_009499 [Oryzias melastigma]
MSSSEYSYDGESLPPSRETFYIVAKLTAEDIFNVVFGIFNENTARKMSRLREELTCETVDAVIDSFREELSPKEKPLPFSQKRMGSVDEDTGSSSPSAPKKRFSRQTETGSPNVSD